MKKEDEYKWDNMVYSFSDKNDVFVNTVCFDASLIEYKNVKASSQDICYLSKKPIKPNINVCHTHGISMHVGITLTTVWNVRCRCQSVIYMIQTKQTINILFVK